MSMGLPEKESHDIADGLERVLSAEDAPFSELFALSGLPHDFYRGKKLVKVDLSGSDLRDLDLTGTVFVNCTIDDDTRFPDDFPGVEAFKQKRSKRPAVVKQQDQIHVFDVAGESVAIPESSIVGYEEVGREKTREIFATRAIPDDAWKAVFGSGEKRAWLKRKRGRSIPLVNVLPPSKAERWRQARGAEADAGVTDSAAMTSAEHPPHTDGSITDADSIPYTGIVYVKGHGQGADSDASYGLAVGGNTGVHTGPVSLDYSVETPQSIAKFALDRKPAHLLDTRYFESITIRSVTPEAGAKTLPESKLTGSDIFQVAMEFVEFSKIATDLDSLETGFLRALRPLGFDRFALRASQEFGEVGRLSRSSGFATDWADFYFDQSYVRYDPASPAGRVFKQHMPFDWGQLAPSLPATEIRESHAIVDYGKEHVYSNYPDLKNYKIVTVPIHIVGAWPGHVTVAGPERLIEPEAEHAIHLMSVYLHDAALRLQNSPAGRIPKLTPRQIECLKWAAAGKTDPEIAEVLSIREKTVNWHIEAAKKKLGVKTRVHAIVQAYLHNLIVY